MLPLFLLACSGPETSVNKLYPTLVVSPTELDLGETIVPYTTSGLVEVVNAGAAPLEIDSIKLSDRDQGVFTLTPETISLEVDQRTSIGIEFEPDQYLDYENAIVLTTNDPDFPTLEIPIAGEGVDGPVPDIDVDPWSVDFSEVVPGEQDWLTFEIQNVGDGPLLIGDTWQSGSGAFSLVTEDPSDQEIAAGGAYPVVVQYSPEGDQGDNGTFTIESDDPDEPSVEVTFLGNGGGSYEYPIACIEGPDSAVPLENIQLDGRCSEDPTGYDLVDWRWTLADAPDGSSTELTVVVDQSVLFLDSAGHYEVQLVVENSVGISSAPAKYELDALPDDQIHIELTWDTANTDLDLHLLEEGAALFDVDQDIDEYVPSDCCYCNPDPSWGESGGSDDPTLALDDVGGYGPENIQIEAPADGNYYVRVHFFGGEEVTEALVTFWVEGVAEKAMRRVLQYNEVWEVGYVEWPDADVIEEDNDPYTTVPRSCPD